MLKVLQSTPYTPIFPPPLPTSNTPLHPSVSCDSAFTSSNETTQKPYVDKLKERHLLLSGLPEELCPPSRETSPGAETRIKALSLRMRKARESHLPLELVLTCVGVKGGDWVGDPLFDDVQDERQFCLPATEEEWFEWEKRHIETRDRRKAEKKAAEHREKIEKWSEAVEEDPFSETREVSKLANRRGHLATRLTDNAVMNEDHEQPSMITSRYCFPGGSQDELLSKHSEPVDRASSPLPPAPALDPVPDFCDSISLPRSPPVIPQDARQICSMPDDIIRSPSFVVKDTDTSTPLKLNHNVEPVLQLSSPVSPPRSLRPLTVSQTYIFPVSLKRRHKSDQPLDGMSHTPSTPHGIKRARTIVEPITPKSVWRPRGSQESSISRDPKRLPTLDALLAASSRKASSRKGSPSIKGNVQDVVETGSPPRRTPSSAVPDQSPSQPTYSMFRPQFQSTQNRAMSLPPSPNHPTTSTQVISPQKSFGGTASSGIGFYQSQFNVERRVDEVTAFLDADVWNVED